MQFLKDMIIIWKNELESGSFQTSRLILDRLDICLETNICFSIGQAYNVLAKLRLLSNIKQEEMPGQKPRGSQED